MEIGFLYALKPEILYHLLTDALEKMDRLYPDAILETKTVTEASEQLVQKCFPNAQPAADIYEAIWSYDLRRF